MNPIQRTAGALAALTLLPAAAGAASLGIDTLPAPVLGAEGEVLNSDVTGLVFQAEGGGSTDPAPGAGLDVALTAAIEGDGTADSAALNAGSASGGLFLGATLEAFGFVVGAGPDVLEFRLSGLSGSAAGPFGVGVQGDVLATLTGEFGEDEAEAFGAGFGLDSTVSASLSVAPVAPIPLPAALPIAALALGGLMLAGRRRG